MFWQTSRFKVALQRPQVMGIVNITPDSFSDGGRHDTLDRALRHCEKLLQEGANILDIGGESTRPGSPCVPLEEELRRVLPLVREAVKLNVPVSVDTYKPQVMQAVLDCGADIINDVWALRQPGAQAAIAQHPQCGVCLMHMHGDPQTMQIHPMEADAVPQVTQFLARQAQQIRALGVAQERITLDPGIGFGKTVAQNFSLLARQSELLQLGYPCLVGWSRKSSIGNVTGLGVDQRMVPSVAAAVLAAEHGAAIVRVHDVAQTVAALAVLEAMRNAAHPESDPSPCANPASNHP